MAFVLIHEIFILYFVRIGCSLYTDRCKSSSLFANKGWASAKFKVCNDAFLSNLIPGGLVKFHSCLNPWFI